MAKTQRVGPLDIGEDIDFQRREWVVERGAWLVVLLILIVGLAGLFGGGPLSHAEASSGPLVLDYERFVRKRAPTELDLRVAPEAVANGEVALWLDQSVVEKIDVERIVPEPVEMEGAVDRVVYRFAVADPEEPAEVTFHLQPAEPGAVRVRMGLVNGAELSIDQFIYP